MADDRDNRGYVQQSFVLQDLYASAFGYIKPPFPQVGLLPKINPFGAIQAIAGSFFNKGKLAAYTQHVTFNAGLADEYQLPCEPTVAVFGTKNVIETYLNRGDRTQNVLEEINLDNYKIRIRGVIYNPEDDAYPEEDVSKIHALWEKPGSRSIKSELLSLLGITKVAIVRINWPELNGYPGAQPYELDCLSDQDFELNIIGDKASPERVPQ